MKLIVGLGNPGIEYQFTPHNLGFRAIDRIADNLGVEVRNRQCRALTGRTQIGEEPVLLAKPETFMNLSGLSVRELLAEYQLKPETDLIVIYDFDHDNPPLIIEDTLGRGIRFTINGAGGSDDDEDASLPVGSVDSGKWVTQAFFDTDGTASEDVTITLASGGNRPVVLSLRGLTCTTTIKMAPVEGQR